VRTDPTDFFHLSPAERIFAATQRLQSAQFLMLEVIRLNEQTRSVYKRSSLKAQVGTGPACRALETLMGTVGGFEIVQVCRLWEAVDPGGFSLPTLASLLKDEEVLQLLRGQLTETLLIDYEYGPPRLEQAESRIQRLGEALKTVERHGASPELKRLRNWRDRRLAHAIYKTRAERKGLISPATWDDLAGLIDGAMTALTAIAASLNSSSGKPIVWEDVRIGTRGQCDSLFSALKYQPDISD
jgi:hypothetical protein